MDIMQLFWLFFIVSALQPVLQRRYLEAMRKRKIAQIEKKRDTEIEAHSNTHAVDNPREERSKLHPS